MKLKNLKELTPEEVKKLIPAGLVDALNADEKDVIYCHTCDGFRVKGHKCIPWHPDIKLP